MLSDLRPLERHHILSEELTLIRANNLIQQTREMLLRIDDPTRMHKDELGKTHYLMRWDDITKVSDQMKLFIDAMCASANEYLFDKRHGIDADYLQRNARTILKGLGRDNQRLERERNLFFGVAIIECLALVTTLAIASL